MMPCMWILYYKNLYKRLSLLMNESTLVGDSDGFCTSTLSMLSTWSQPRNTSRNQYD